jgi:hypothetical protein
MFSDSDEQRACELTDSNCESPEIRARKVFSRTKPDIEGYQLYNLLEKDGGCDLSQVNDPFDQLRA